MSVHSPVARAHAACNLLSLKRAPGSVRELLDRWTCLQTDQSIQTIDQAAARSPWIEDLGDAPFGRLHLTFHFSFYPRLFDVLGRRAPGSEIVSLIGSQRDRHRRALLDLGNRHGVSIRFIESGSSMIRQMRSALAEGLPGMLMLDLPWSKSLNDPDVRYPVSWGRVLGHSTVARLVPLIDRDFAVCAVSAIGDSFLLQRRFGLDLNAAYQWFGRLMEEAPEGHERLHELHRFAEFDHVPSCWVLFNNDGNEVIMDPKDHKTWKVGNGSLATNALRSGAIIKDHPLLRKLTASRGRTVDGILYVGGWEGMDV